MISAPAQIFEAMFEKVKQVGISELMLENMLNKVSEQYGINWQHLHQITLSIKLMSICFSSMIKMTLLLTLKL